jgi:ATP-binding cassette subfamily C exporter for protease/lipase
MSDATSPGEIRSVLRGFRRTLVAVGCFSAVVNFLMLGPSFYMLQVYDRVLPSRNETTLWMLTGLVLGLFLMSSLLDSVRTLVVARLADQIDTALGQRTFEASLRLNLLKPQAHVTQPLSDLGQLRQFVASPALFAFFDAPWFPFYLFVIFLFSTWLGWFAVGGTVLLVALALLNEWVTSAAQRDSSRTSVRAMQIAAGTFRNAEVVGAMGMQQALYRRWAKVHAEVGQLQLRMAERAQAIGGVSRFFKLSLQSLVLGLGALLVLKGEMSGGMMIAASILMGRALAPVEQLIGVRRQWGTMRDAHKRLSQLLSNHPAPPDRLQLPEPTGLLSVESLSLAPPGVQQLAVREVTFSLQPGDVLGVIGPSGSGKSSLARALVGVWPPARGAVRLDGAELAHWSPEQLGAAIGYMPQDVELLEGTVAENIARFQEDADPNAVFEAAIAAGVHELVLRMPQGYDTPLGDRGVGLSGGQKQRIALARAVFGWPRLVVLDEPNSNLDEAGEQALLRCVQQLREHRCTVVLVTHRSSTLSTAGKLLLMHEGKLQMFGPREKLLAALAKARNGGAATAQEAAPAALGHE